MKRRQVFMTFTVLTLSSVLPGHSFSQITITSTDFLSQFNAKVAENNLNN